MKRIIVFAPHPDDETFGCGGTIAKRINEGYEVLIVVMTDGRHAFLNVFGIDSDPTPEQLKQIRKEELINAARILGIQENNIIFLDFIDGKLKDFEAEAEEKVTEILRDNPPDEIYFPYKRDGHPDHQATYRIVKKSLETLGISTKKFQYSITHKYARAGRIIEALLNFFHRKRKTCIDVSKFLDRKKRAITQFRSEITAISKRQHKPVIVDTYKFLGGKEEFYIDE